MSLLQLVVDEVAVNGEYGVGDVFDHSFDDAGFDHADYRDVCGHAGEVELIDACTDREDDFEVRKGAGGVFGWLPGGEVADLRGIAGFWPYVKWRIRGFLGKEPCPLGSAFGTAFVEKAHFARAGGRGLGGRVLEG